MPCPSCQGYFAGWRSHGPTFPSEAWEILESQEFEVGTHAAVTVMCGVARCRACGQRARFDCSYGEGYRLEPEPRDDP